MPSRTPLAAVPFDASTPREPGLSSADASAGPRLGPRTRPQSGLELRAHERAIVTSGDPAATSRREPWPLAAKVAFGVMGLLALFGAAMLVRLFLGV